MRLLHTSDWHLGKRLFDRERYQVFEQFLQWLLENIRLQRIDTLIVAGDIFDTAVPTNKSQQLYYRFLGLLPQFGCRHVVIVSGNHDSPTFLDAPKEVLSGLGVHVIGSAGSPEQEVVALKNEHGELEGIVCAVPFLRERDILRIEEGSQLTRNQEIEKAIERHYQKVVKAAIDMMGAKRVPLIATGHLFTNSAPVGVDENELYIGTSGCVPASVFPEEIDYLALGHIHNSYIIGGDKTRNYCGAPIVFNFDEAGRNKIVRVVDFSEGKPDVSDLIVPKFDNLCRVSGNRSEILDRLQKLAQQKEEILIEVVHQGSNEAVGLIEDVRSIAQGTNLTILRIFDQSRRDRFLADDSEDIEISMLTWDNVFQYRLKGEEEDEIKTEELWDAYKQTYQEVSGLSDTNAL